MARASEIPGLDCAANLPRGAQLVLRTRLEEMCALRAAALDWSSIEGVHDMRVASRRLRSALRDFTPYLRKRELRSLRDGVKAVADALGGVRDRDVSIRALEKLLGESPPSGVGAGIEHLIAKHIRQREKARVALVKAISENTLAKLLWEGSEALDRAARKARPALLADPGEGAPAAAINFRQGGCAIITARWREMSDLSGALYRPLKSDPLHRMRIAAKRLRYATELFAKCWSGALTPFAKEIAGLQSSLGEVHDCDVWVEALGDQLRRDEGQPAAAEAAGSPTAIAPGDERRAAVWLLQHFAAERTSHFREALGRWDSWEAEHFAERLFMTLEETLPAQSDGHDAQSAVGIAEGSGPAEVRGTS